MIGFDSRRPLQMEWQLTRGNTPKTETVRTPDYSPGLHAPPQRPLRRHTCRPT